MALYALGLNHQTAPLDIRERVVFHVERMRDALRDLRRSLARSGDPVDLQPHRVVPRGRTAGGGHDWLAEYHRLRTDDITPYLYTLPGAGGSPRVPRRLRARFDGAGRAADPRPDEGGGAPR